MKTIRAIARISATVLLLAGCSLSLNPASNDAADTKAITPTCELSSVKVDGNVEYGAMRRKAGKKSLEVVLACQAEGWEVTHLSTSGTNNFDHLVVLMERPAARR